MGAILQVMKFCVSFGYLQAFHHSPSAFDTDLDTNLQHTKQANATELADHVAVLP